MPSGGPRFNPLICTSPPRPTVPGAGSWVKKLVTPRALITGAVGAWAQSRAAPATQANRKRHDCMVNVDFNPNHGAGLRRSTLEYVMEKAVCLLSGGLDSATCLALARRDGYQCYALSFDYGQRHKIELTSAARVAKALGAERHLVARIGLDAFGGSALTSAIEVPKGRSAGEMGEGIPVTYVPARNTIFLSFALAWAEVLASSHIFIGVNALDYSGYPDCRPEFIEAYERMANLATKAGVEGRTRVRIHTPLLHLTKAGIVKLGRELGLDFALTFSCYDPAADGRACGQCDACLLRRKGFHEAGIEDR